MALLLTYRGFSLSLSLSFILSSFLSFGTTCLDRINIFSWLLMWRSVEPPKVFNLPGNTSDCFCRPSVFGTVAFFKFIQQCRKYQETVYFKWAVNFKVLTQTVSSWVSWCMPAVVTGGSQGNGLGSPESSVEAWVQILPPAHWTQWNQSSKYTELSYWVL